MNARKFDAAVYFRITSLILAAVFLTSCSTPDTLSKEERNKIRKVAVRVEGPVGKETIYVDRTTMALLYGTGGGLIGGLAGAANMAAGETRFTPVTEPHRKQVLGILDRSTVSAIQGVGKLGQPADATLEVKEVRFGVGHEQDQRFAAYLATHIQLVDPKGKPIMDTSVVRKSTQTFKRLEAQNNPALYRSALEEAAKITGQGIANAIWLDAYPSEMTGRQLEIQKDEAEEAADLAKDEAERKEREARKKAKANAQAR